jgi:hypothetical protein
MDIPRREFMLTSYSAGFSCWFRYLRQNLADAYRNRQAKGSMARQRSMGREEWMGENEIVARERNLLCCSRSRQTTIRFGHNLIGTTIASALRLPKLPYSLRFWVGSALGLARPQSAAGPLPLVSYIGRHLKLRPQAQRPSMMSFRTSA